MTSSSLYAGCCLDYVHKCWKSNQRSGFQKGQLLKQLARIRDIETGPDGNAYLLLEHEEGGRIVRLVPAERGD
jgi:glucose/arabinose dehydrogenase